MSSLENLNPIQIIQYLLDGFDCGLNSVQIGLAKTMEALKVPANKIDEVLAALKSKIEINTESSSRIFTELLMKEVFSEYSSAEEEINKSSSIDKNLVDEARMLHMQLYNEKYKNLKLKQDIQVADMHVEELRIITQDWPDEQQLNEVEDQLLAVLNN
ncbi:unnamed protein product [Blepharisma stoltei]|uniref:Uncharacterized protein n=1 Tax=Blepharisma stoltei TaxID=1481888 RepID=A0AAU9IPZ5_9CILI|nr:unnamed protein product [Blepharisma stoltei]